MAKSSKTNKKSAAKSAPKSAPKSRPKGEETLTISKTALWQIVSGVLVVILAVLLIFNVMGSNTQAPIPTQPGQPAPAPSGPVQINLEGVRSIGDENAPVTIVEYSDFTCPFCKRFYDETYNQIKQNYIDEGIVRFVYKDFPVVGGQRAAEAGWCAHEQNLFFEYKAKIFANPTQASDSNLVAWAGEIGLDVAQFRNCLTTGKYQANVAQERQEAINNGIRGTPGFLVNDQLVSGAQPYSVFQQAIAQALN